MSWARQRLKILSYIGSLISINQVEMCREISPVSLQWRHNGRDSVSNHQPHDCLLNRLFRHRSKKTSKLRVTGLCARNSPVTDEFPAQMASNAENVSIWWRHHVAVTGSTLNFIHACCFACCRRVSLSLSCDLWRRPWSGTWSSGKLPPRFPRRVIVTWLRLVPCRPIVSAVFGDCLLSNCTRPKARDIFWSFVFSLFSVGVFGDFLTAPSRMWPFKAILGLALMGVAIFLMCLFLFHREVFVTRRIGATSATHLDCL